MKLHVFFSFQLDRSRHKCPSEFVSRPSRSVVIGCYVSLTFSKQFVIRYVFSKRPNVTMRFVVEILLYIRVLVNCYSGTLMSSLTLTKFKATINSLEDLAASQDLTMTASANSVMAQTMLVSRCLTLGYDIKLDRK